MSHINVSKWKEDKKGRRPCDWCGKPLLNDEKSIHRDTCLSMEARFYTQLGYDGESDVKLPEGYKVVIQ